MGVEEHGSGKVRSPEGCVSYLCAPKEGAAHGAFGEVGVVEIDIGKNGVVEDEAFAFLLVGGEPEVVLGEHSGEIIASDDGAVGKLAGPGGSLECGIGVVGSE